MKCLFAALILVGLVGLTSSAFGYVASSDSYRIDSDSLNFVGGTSTSASYNLNSSGGELATGTSTSATYNLNAGYQAMLGGILSVSVPSDVTFSSIHLADGGQVNSSVAWTVSSVSGYQLSVKASTNPALQGAGARVSLSIPDYAGAPDFDWSVGASQSGFGFSPESADLISTYKNNGTSCGSGSGTTGHCWDGFSTTNQLISQYQSGGASRTTTLKLRTEVGSEVYTTTETVATTINMAATLTATVVGI